jgi:hypothetical protein
MHIPKTPAVRIVLAGTALCFAGACSDDRPVASQLTTAPPRPALTSRNLPSDAPTICVASVRRRDRLIAVAHPTAATTRDIRALDDVIDDVCR